MVYSTVTRSTERGIESNQEGKKEIFDKKNLEHSLDYGYCLLRVTKSDILFSAYPATDCESSCMLAAAAAAAAPLDSLIECQIGLKVKS